jgi:SAM-dependent methyltransferase
MAGVDLASFAALLAPHGQAALVHAAALDPTEETFLAAFNRLTRHHPADLARAALETAMMRRKARAKFSRADHMYFTRESLEQSSGEVVARYRAGRFAAFQRVGDFCCGIGGDSVALAAVSRVAAVDLDPLRLAMARQNAVAYEVADRITFREADLRTMPPPDVEAFFCDPSRRTGGRRRLSVKDYEPPLDVVCSWRERIAAVGVKIAPGASWDELREFGAEAEFVSADGELKECALWFGPLRTVGRRATLLPGRHTLATVGPSPPPRLNSVRQYLYEPDPAVLRAGLVTDLAELLGASQIDADIAYLTTDELRPTPFAAAFRIDEALPFQLKRLRQRLRELRVGRVVVKKRGSPLDPAALVRQLRLTGDESRVLFLTRVAGRPFALIGQPLAAAP